MLNAATASGLLGATAAAAASREPCAFTAAGGEIKIAVVTIGSPKEFQALAAACGSAAAPLPVIGNEAVICDADADRDANRNGGRAVRVVGRVRDQAFILVIRSTDASLTAEKLREKGRAAAEIVAGNLF